MAQAENVEKYIQYNFQQKLKTGNSTAKRIHDGGNHHKLTERKSYFNFQTTQWSSKQRLWKSAVSWGSDPILPTKHRISSPPKWAKTTRKRSSNRGWRQYASEWGGTRCIGRRWRYSHFRKYSFSGSEQAVSDFSAGLVEFSCILILYHQKGLHRALGTYKWPD